MLKKIFHCLLFCWVCSQSFSASIHTYQYYIRIQNKRNMSIKGRARPWIFPTCSTNSTFNTYTSAPLSKMTLTMGKNSSFSKNSSRTNMRKEGMKNNFSVLTDTLDKILTETKKASMDPNFNRIILRLMHFLNISVVYVL